MTLRSEPGSLVFIQIPESSRQMYSDLAVSILLKHNTDDFYVNRIECINCDSLIPDW